ncbi:MAG: hypothetical protein AAGC77_09980 [Pseudomonadota bacterium]
MSVLWSPDQANSFGEYFAAYLLWPFILIVSVLIVLAFNPGAWRRALITVTLFLSFPLLCGLIFGIEMYWGDNFYEAFRDGVSGSYLAWPLFILGLFRLLLVPFTRIFKWFNYIAYPMLGLTIIVHYMHLYALAQE